jgi:hypothetical protein
MNKPIYWATVCQSTGHTDRNVSCEIKNIIYIHMYVDKSEGSFVTKAKHVVTDVMRSLFSPRTQKFVKAGYLTKCSDFTPAFDNAVRLIALEKWGEELEAKADEVIEEQDAK